MEKMSQSGMLGAALIAGFVLWLAMNGKLQTYWGFLTGAGASGSAAAPAGGTVQPGGVPGGVTPSGIPGVPGVTLNPTQGLPHSVCQFVLGGMPFGLGNVCGNN